MHQSQVLRVFVSHSHTDDEFGLRLVNDLRRTLGSDDSVWYDAAGGLNGGDQWWNKIVSELTSREVFIVILSPASLASPWVNDEINLAWKQKNSTAQKRIIPILWQPCKLRPDLEMLQFISFVPPKIYQESYAELLTALGFAQAMAPGTHAPVTSSAPKPAEQPLQFHGTSPAASPKFMLKNDLTIVRASYEGRRIFRVDLLDEKGNRAEQFFNIYGAFNGAKALGLRQPGTYLLNIHADDRWKVSIEQPDPRALVVSNARDFAGAVPSVTAPFYLPGGLTTARMSYEGRRIFHVDLLDSKGNRVDRLATKYGAFNGAKAIGIKQPGIHLLSIYADDKWVVHITVETHN